MPPMKTAKFIDPDAPLPDAPEVAKPDQPTRLVPVEKESGMFPVKLAKNYRPVDAFFVWEEEAPSMEDSPMRRRQPTGEERAKVKAGNVIDLPVDEARRLMKLKLAERADALGV